MNALYRTPSPGQVSEAYPGVGVKQYEVVTTDLAFGSIQRGLKSFVVAAREYKTMRKHRNKKYRILSQQQKDCRKEAKRRFINPEQLCLKEPKTELSWDPAAGDQIGFGLPGIMTWDRSVAHELLADPDFDVGYVMIKDDEAVVWSGEEVDDTVVELYDRAASEVPLTTGDLLWRLSQKVESLNPERVVITHRPREVEESA